MHCTGNLEVVYGLDRDTGLAGGCWLSEIGRQQNSFLTIIELFTSKHKLKLQMRRICSFTEEKLTGHQDCQHHLLSANKRHFCSAVKPLSSR